MVLAIPKFIGNVRRYLRIVAEAVNDLDGSGGDLGERVDDLEDALETGLSYSTSETATGGKWINDAPIYRKVIAFLNGPNNSELSIAHGITGLTKVIDMKAVMNATTSHRQIPFVGDPSEDKSPSDPSSIQMRISGNNILIKSVGDYSGSAGHVIVEYTRS